MRDVPVFKKRYVVVPVIVLLAGIYYIYTNLFPLGQTIYKKVKINDFVNLYITQADAGATTSFSYRYYLYDAKKNDIDFMKQVGNESPFMITDDEKATATIENGQLHLHVKGNVYSFDNVSYRVNIHLDASPY